MLQFYFLSIVLNAACGYILFSDNGEKEISSEGGFEFSPENGIFRLILGIASLLVGILKLLSVTQGDVPVIGDLLPALMGALTGFVFIFAHFKRRSSLDMGNTEKLEGAINKHSKWIGLAAMIIAGLHFLFPTVLLL